MIRARDLYPDDFIVFDKSQEPVEKTKINEKGRKKK